MTKDEEALIESLERLDLKFSNLPHRPSITQAVTHDASEESV